MPEMRTITCKCGCGRTKEVRKADVDRGWGLFFDKSCKAKWQTKKYNSKRPPYNPKRKLRPAEHERRQGKRHACLVAAWSAGRISDQYYYMTLENEYPQFMSAEDRAECASYDEHPFSSEALGQY